MRIDDNGTFWGLAMKARLVAVVASMASLPTTCASARVHAARVKDELKR